MDWLFPSVVATCTGSCVLFFVYLYLAHTYRESHLYIWASSWAVYMLRFVIMLISLYVGESPIFAILIQVASLTSGLLLLAGILKFLGKRFPLLVLILGSAGVAWCIVGELINAPFLIYTLPTFTFLAAVYIGCGITLLTREELVGIGSRVAGWSLILWGIHKADYPWLRGVEWFAPWGYLIGAILSLSCALGIILMYYEFIQRKLESSEKRYRHLFENMAQGVFYQQADGKIVDCNPAALNMLGLTLEQFLGKTSMDPDWHVVTEDGEKLSGELHPSMVALQTGKPIKDQVLGVFNPRKKDFIWLSINAIPQFHEDAFQPYQVFVTLHDMTERKVNQERYSLILKTALDGFWLLDSKGRFLEVNDAYCTMSGYDRSELMNMSISDVEAKENIEQVQNHLEQVRKSGSDRFVTQHCRKNGDTITVEISIAVINAPHELWYCFVRDITELKCAEQKMLQQQRAILLNNRIAKVFLTAETAEIYHSVLEILREFLDSQFGYFGYIDDQGNFVSASMTKEIWSQCEVADKTIIFPKENWGGLWGRSLIEQRPLLSKGGLRVPEGHVQLENALAVPIIHHEKLIGQFVLGNKPGGFDEQDEELLVNAAAQTAPVLYSLLEEERQKREHKILEEHLRQAQKMEAIGALAGGIAHDFNNIMAVILGYAEILKDNLAENSPENLSYVSQILQSSERASKLVGQILAFSRKAEIEVQPFDLGTLVKETAKMLRGAIPSSVCIEVYVSDEPNIIMADVTQINQVIMNLCTNAWHAMVEEGGTMKISVNPYDILDQKDSTVPNLEPGSYIKLEVEDTGQGIEEQDIPRIFEPFFTTKPQGKGTGMGLSVVHGIVSAHGGHISVHSKTGSGTKFEILLPRSEEIESTVKEDKVNLIPSGNENILLVDDEEAVLAVASNALSSLGYKITTQTSGFAALSDFYSNPSSYDLIITDLSMPGMTGLQLAKEIKSKKEDAKIILCTGYGDNASLTRARETGVVLILRKPVRKRQFAESVRAVLDGKVSIENRL